MGEDVRYRRGTAARAAGVGRAVQRALDDPAPRPHLARPAAARVLCRHRTARCLRRTNYCNRVSSRPLTATHHVCDAAVDEARRNSRYSCCGLVAGGTSSFSEPHQAGEGMRRAGRSSGRGRAYARRPPTPPYVRFRIRRFNEHSGVVAARAPTRPTPRVFRFRSPGCHRAILRTQPHPCQGCAPHLAPGSPRPRALPGAQKTPRGKRGASMNHTS